ncbi:MAG TPA: hypothetical protein DCW42_00390 [Bacteroidetes bacterium]|nr:hypothetical protein [Bacteroidota bacterium]
MKNLKIVPAIVLLGIVFLAGCSTKKVDPVQLFLDADKAASKVNSAEFELVMKTKMNTETESFKTKIFAKRNSGETNFPIYFRMEEPNVSLVTYDGKQIIITSYADKNVSVSDSIEFASEIAKQISNNFNMIIDTKFDSAEIRATSQNLEYVGTKSIDGEKCYEVKQIASGHNSAFKIETHFYFSKNSSLLKGYHSIIKNEKDEIVQDIDLNIAKLKLNQNIISEVFSQKIDPSFAMIDLDQQNPHDGMNMEEGGDGMNMEEGQSGMNNTSTIPNGQKAPAWTLKDKDGKAYSLDALKGKVVLMDFWATWCSPCKQVMPEIQKIWNKYKNQNVIVVGINTWEQTGDPAKFMKDNNYNYILLLNGNDVAKSYNVSGIPTLYVIDKNGNVAHSEVGAVPDLGTKLDKVIADLIKK